MNQLIYLLIVGLAVAHADVPSYFYDTEDNQAKGNFLLSLTSIEENDKPLQTESQFKVHREISKIVKSIIHDDNLHQRVPSTFRRSVNSEDLTYTEPPVLQIHRMKVGEDVFQHGKNFAEVLPIPIRSDKLESYGDVSYKAESHAKGHRAPNGVRFYKFKQETPEQKFTTLNRQLESAFNKQYFINRQISNQQEFHNSRSQAVAQEPFFDVKQSSSKRQQFPNNFHVEMLTQYKEDFQGISRLNDQVYKKQIRLPKTNDVLGNNELNLFSNEQQPVQSTQESEADVNKKLWFKNGASVRQHLQTPYVRYGYSYLL